MEKTRTGFFSKLARIVVGKSTVDDEVLDNLEEVYYKPLFQLHKLVML